MRWERNAIVLFWPFRVHEAVDRLLGRLEGSRTWMDATRDESFSGTLPERRRALLPYVCNYLYPYRETTEPEAKPEWIARLVEAILKVFRETTEPQGKPAVAFTEEFRPSARIFRLRASSDEEAGRTSEPDAATTFTRFWDRALIRLQPRPGSRADEPPEQGHRLKLLVAELCVFDVGVGILRIDLELAARTERVEPWRQARAELHEIEAALRRTPETGRPDPALVARKRDLLATSVGDEDRTLDRWEDVVRGLRASGFGKSHGEAGCTLLWSRDGRVREDGLPAIINALLAPCAPDCQDRGLDARLTADERPRNFLVSTGTPAHRGLDDHDVPLATFVQVVEAGDEPTPALAAAAFRILNANRRESEVGQPSPEALAAMPLVRDYAGTVTCATGDCYFVFGMGAQSFYAQLLHSFRWGLTGLHELVLHQRTFLIDQTLDVAIADSKLADSRPRKFSNEVARLRDETLHFDAKAVFVEVSHRSFHQRQFAEMTRAMRVEEMRRELRNTMEQIYGLVAERRAGIFAFMTGVAALLSLPFLLLTGFYGMNVAGLRDAPFGAGHWYVWAPALALLVLLAAAWVGVWRISWRRRRLRR